MSNRMNQRWIAHMGRAAELSEYRTSRGGLRWRSRGLTASLVLLLPILLIGCEAAGSPSSAEKVLRLRNIETERLQALVDVNAEVVQRIHAADFELINPYGERYGRADYLSQILSGQLDYTVWDPGEMAVRAYADVAVIRYEDEAFEARFDGEVVSEGRLYHTNVYEKRGGQWKIVWSHASGGR